MIQQAFDGGVDFEFNERVNFGTITDYDAIDGLGWIKLDDGRTVRFSLTACGYLRPAQGLRVRVLGLTEGYQGALKAAFVEEVEPGGEGI